MQEKVETERKDIVTEFEQLHQFLKEQEERLLTQLEELDKDLEKQKDDMMTKISEELSRLGDVITEMEVKCKQPASEFLQVRLCDHKGLSFWLGGDLTNESEALALGSQGFGCEVCEFLALRYSWSNMNLDVIPTGTQNKDLSIYSYWGGGMGGGNLHIGDSGVQAIDR